MRRDAECAIIVGVDVIEVAVIAAPDEALFQQQRAVRPLRRGQAAAIDVELVLLGLAADDRVIFKQQARAAGPGALAEFIGGRHAREAAAHDDEVRSAEQTSELKSPMPHPYAAL